MSTVALSQTLKTITNLKIRELQKQRKAYDTHKNFVLDHAKSAGDDERLRVYRLLCGVEKMESVPTSQVNLSNIRSWLDQSKFDASIPDTILCDFEKQLRSQLDVQTRKLDLASLYSSLLTEWLTKSNDDLQDTTIPDDNSLDGSFELVEKDRLKQLKEKFESVVFTPLETDEGEIDNYLSTLFEGDKGEKALERLKNNTKNKGNHLLKQKAPFNEDSLRWCLKGLLGNDLLSDDKKVILQDFLKDEVARGEICDVLNMKYADLGNWEWDAEENGMPVEPRRQLNGKYRIMMDEDVLQAIFLHYIGMMWSVSLKSSLGELLKYTELWKHDKHIPRDEADRRLYFLGENCAWGSESVARERQEVYRQDFFMSQLPSSVYEGAGGYDDDDDEDVDERDSDKKSSKEVKQLLLRQLATETHLHLALNGKVAVVQSDMQWFGTSLPHSSICAVLRFIGMPEGWVRFFKKFLEAPLNMGPVSDDPAANRVRIRLRGTPMAHALEKFFGELVLFFMDLAVNQEAEMLLYRFHDDLWLCGEPRKCSKAWIAMKKCATVMGLEFNLSKTGSVHITRGKVEKDNDLTLPEGPVSFGFLILDSRDGEWIIDQQEVDKHVKQLKKQLSHCNSILSWVQTWNSCIGRFFSHTFGEPANCFGKSHVDRILETYKRMQDEIFDGSNITTYLKALIAERFGVTDIPDAFVFMPEELGGLGVRNPFIPLFLVRDQVFKDPASFLTKFLKEQEEGYKAAAKEFEELDDKERARRLRKIYVDDYNASSFGEEIFDKKIESNKPSNLTTSTTFMTFDEFRKWDESVSISLARTYRSLMDEAMKKHIVISRRVKDALADMDILLSDMDGERKWLLMLYEKELFEKCGGLSIVRKDLLPLGILTILRQKRVSWQMVL